MYIYVWLVSRLKSDYVWSFNALSVPFMPSFHYIPHYFIWVSIVHGVYIYFFIVLLLPRYDNDTPRYGRGLGFYDTMFVCLSVITVCSHSMLPFVLMTLTF